MDGANSETRQVYARFFIWNIISLLDIPAVAIVMVSGFAWRKCAVAGSKKGYYNKQK
jgi:hypothetical protein